MTILCRLLIANQKRSLQRQAVTGWKKFWLCGDKPQAKVDKYNKESNMGKYKFFGCSWLLICFAILFCIFDQNIVLSIFHTDQITTETADFIHEIVENGNYNEKVIIFNSIS